MSDWLYRQAVHFAASGIADAYLVYLTFPPDVARPSLEVLARDLIRTDPLPCRGIQGEGGREVMFDWSFEYDDVPAIVQAAGGYVDLATGQASSAPRRSAAFAVA